MKEQAEKIRTFVKEKIDTAHARIHSLPEEAQKFVKTVGDKVKATPVDGIKRIEEMLEKMPLRDLAEKLKADEFLKYGESIQRKFLAQMGLAVASDIEEIKTSVADIRKKVDALEGQGSGVTKNVFERLSKQVGDLRNEVRDLRKAARAPKAKE
jgi:gas vesicle protein